MKKGFTLVELLAVIVILAIVLAIAVPSISSIIKESTKSALMSDAKMVLKAIDYKKMQDENFDATSVTEENIYSLLQLSNANYTSLDIGYYNNELNIRITGKNKWAGLTACGSFKNIAITEGGECVNDYTAPRITLIGDNPMSISQGATYTEPGATATDNVEGDLTSNIVISGTVNTSVIGQYQLTYTVSDSKGNQRTAVRTVNVEAGINKPVLASNMIPVMWNGSTWVKADSTNADTTYSWYDYTNKIWANAVTVSSTNRSTYLSAAVGTAITPSDILAYYVWIPRYAYQIATNYHTNTTGTINIKFLRGTTNVAVDSTTVDTTPTYSGSSQTNYIVHPAFTFGSTPIAGMWVAKFESSPAAGTTCYTTPSISNCNVTGISLRSLPNTSAWRYIQVGNAYYIVRNLESTGNAYGFVSNEVDTHMMKNTEWGAVAYFTQSAYGKNSEVWGNNSSTYTTGCVGDSVSAIQYAGCQFAYNTDNGKNASTTGNIYGIYDMSGGAYEIMSAYAYCGITTTSLYYGNNILTEPDKYKDVYPYTSGSISTTLYANAATKKGDAYYETSSLSTTEGYSWNSDSSLEPTVDKEWFSRGGYFGTQTRSGVFGYNRTYATGDSNIYTSFRVVLMVGTGL